MAGELPVISIADATGREPTGAGTSSAQVLFTVTLDRPSGQPVSVAYATSLGDGAHPAAGVQIYMFVNGVKMVVAGGATYQYMAFVADYVHDQDTLTFAPGETEKTIAIGLVRSLAQDEPAETFTLTLSDAVGATIGDGVAVGTIVDAAVPIDTVPSIHMTWADTSREPQFGYGSSMSSVRIVLGHAHTAPVSVDYATSGGTAVAGVDYDAMAGSVTFAPGEFEKYIEVPIHGDEEVEATESFSFVLSNPVGGTIAVTSLMTKIVDTQPPVPLPENYFGVTSDGVSSNIEAGAYAGPVAGLTFEFIAGAADDVVAGTGQGDFINLKAGSDAVNGLGGNDVLDGGLGSNFLTGGDGTDTFFLDARELTGPVWSTVTDLAAGEGVTLWGISAEEFMREWIDGMGAQGFTGLTLSATKEGLPAAMLTLTGYTTADLASGRLLQAFGFEPVSDSDYMYLYATS